MKHYIDLLGIVLPALILLFAFLRLFLKNTKWLNRLSVFCAILLLLVGIIRYSFFSSASGSADNPKPPPLTVGRHSPAFYQQTDAVLTAYFSLTDGFVSGDSTRINAAAASLQTAMDSFHLDELRPDTLIYETAQQPYQNIKSELAAIRTDPAPEEKKASLNILSNELYTLLRTVRYDAALLFWKECPTAFGEDRPGNWLSKSETSVNPYGQAGCAETRSKISFVEDSVHKNEPAPTP